MQIAEEIPSNAASSTPTLSPDANSAAAGRSVRLFRNGANQAVRIPKDFELPGRQAFLRRVGDCLVLEPVVELPVRGTVAALAGVLTKLSLEQPGDWNDGGGDFPMIEDDMLPLDDIIFDNANSAPTTP